MIKKELQINSCHVKLLKGGSTPEFFIDSETRNPMIEDMIMKEFGDGDATFFYKNKFFKSPMVKTTSIYDLVLKRRNIPFDEKINSEIQKFLWYDTMQGNITKNVEILKAEDAGEDEDQIVFGEVLVPEDVDAHGDIYSAKEVRDAAWFFMENFGNIGFMHRFFINGEVKILESYVTLKSMTLVDMKGKKRDIKKGTWLMRTRILSEAIWQMAKDGKLTGFSIGGLATVQQLKKFLEDMRNG